MSASGKGGGGDSGRGGGRRLDRRGHQGRQDAKDWLERTSERQDRGGGRLEGGSLGVNGKSSAWPHTRVKSGMDTRWRGAVQRLEAGLRPQAYIWSEGARAGG